MPIALRLLGALLLCGAVAACGGDDGPTVVVFTASSLAPAIEPLADAFVAANPDVGGVEVNSGGSDALARLIVDGAPADVLLTADLDTMDLIDDRDVEPEIVAFNHVSVVVPADNPAGITDVGDLAGPGVTVALCEPVVPCGAAALELFELRGIDVSADTLEPNVRSALTKVELGEVDAAVVYRTDAAASDRVIEIPVGETPPRPVAVAVVSDDEAAGAFVEFLLSPEAAAILDEFGFETPR